MPSLLEVLRMFMDYTFKELQFIYEHMTREQIEKTQQGAKRCTTVYAYILSEHIFCDFPIPHGTDIQFLFHTYQG
jgi:hypothetical protein